MLRDHLDLVLRLVLTILAISATLCAMVVGFKMRRDRIERRSRMLRSRLLAAWQALDYPEILATDTMVARGSIHDQADFAAICHAAVGADWWTEETASTLARAAQESGLTTALRRQLGSRRAARRGLAIVIGGYGPTSLDPREVMGSALDPDATVRIATVACLERIATADAARALIAGLRRGTLPGPRFIERLGHPWAVPTILDALEEFPDTSEDDERVRCDLLRALSLANDPRATSVALRIAGTGREEEQIQALRILASTVGLCGTETKQRIEELAARLAQDPHPNIRGLVVPVLHNAEDAASMQALAGLVSDPDWFVRRRAARALATLGSVGEGHLRRIAAGPDRFAAERAAEELAELDAAPHAEVEHAETSHG